MESLFWSVSFQFIQHKYTYASHTRQATVIGQERIAACFERCGKMNGVWSS